MILNKEGLQLRCIVFRKSAWSISGHWEGMSIRYNKRKRGKILNWTEKYSQGIYLCCTWVPKARWYLRRRKVGNGTPLLMMNDDVCSKSAFAMSLVKLWYRMMIFKASNNMFVCCEDWTIQLLQNYRLFIFVKVIYFNSVYVVMVNVKHMWVPSFIVSGYRRLSFTPLILRGRAIGSSLEQTLCTRPLVLLFTTRPKALTDLSTFDSHKIFPILDVDSFAVRPFCRFQHLDFSIHYRLYPLKF